MKLPNGYGSVVKQSGNRRKPYMVRVTIGHDGKIPIRKVLGFYETQADAMQALAEYNGNPFDLTRDKTTFRDVYDMAKNDFSKSRMHNYRSAFRYLEPIADLPIRSIKAAQMQNCIDSCQTTQQREIKTVCRKVFAYAIRNELIDRNPAEYLNSNTIKPSIIREVFTPEEVKELWSINEWWSDVAILLLYTGMRTKELMDLEDDDIDLTENVIHIRKAKNQSSIRTIPIHEAVICRFKAFKDNRRTFTHNGFNMRLKAKTGHKAHDCRHTFTTRMRECGCDLLVLQLILGHAPRTITEKVYTHISMDELRDAVNALCYQPDP